MYIALLLKRTFSAKSFKERVHLELHSAHPLDKYSGTIHSSSQTSKTFPRSTADVSLRVGFLSSLGMKHHPKMKDTYIYFVELPESGHDLIFLFHGVLPLFMKDDHISLLTKSNALSFFPQFKLHLPPLGVEDPCS